MIKIISSNNINELDKLRRLLSPDEGLVTRRSAEITRKVFGKPLKPIEVVRTIIADIKKTGDKAVLKYNKLIDRVSIPVKNLEVTRQEIKKAYQKVQPQFVQAVRKACKNIRTYQKKIKYSFKQTINNQGLKIKLKVQALEKAGIYIPGGAALYPSSVLMTIVPAKTAGVNQVIMVTPPGKDGNINEHLLVTADIAGADRIYKTGGVQAVAALAYGTRTIPRVDKIAGPGNLFISLAKKELYGQVDIDMFAGPSEIIILADSTANPEFIALDLLAQAEHYPGSAILITPDRKLAEKVNQAIIKNIQNLSRQEQLKEVIKKYCLQVIVKNMAEAIKISNDFAPEHLEVICKDAEKIIRQIKNAGAVFVGNYTPVALGDYYAGPSHTLPTGGTARFFSGVNVNDFLKTSAVISASKPYLQKHAEYIEVLADAEGLDAHKRSVNIRKK